MNENNALDLNDDFYRISLDGFEGPLDLLLHLIKKNDVDIYDIPIAFILEEYLGFIERAKDLNIDVAGDFLVLAAELILIKSKLLMPIEEEGSEEEGPDPRKELVRRLLEYQRFKEAGHKLLERPLLGSDVFTRGIQEEAAPEEEMLEAEMNSLICAFQDVLKRLPKDKAYEVHRENISVSEKILSLTERLKRNTDIKFTELFEPEKGRENVIVTFIALLEMAKMRMIRIRQGISFDEIFISSQVSEAQLTEPI